MHIDIVGKKKFKYIKITRVLKNKQKDILIHKNHIELL
jgi:hypothetical protein